MDEPASKPLRLAVVGPCASGKTTLVEALKAMGYAVRQPAQEHSYVPDMWQRLSKPDLLIYLDVDDTACRQRRPYLGGGLQRLDVQRHRLRHARQYCDFYLDTSPLSAEEVCTAVLRFLKKSQDAGNPAA